LPSRIRSSTLCRGVTFLRRTAFPGSTLCKYSVLEISGANWIWREAMGVPMSCGCCEVFNVQAGWHMCLLMGGTSYGSTSHFSFDATHAGLTIDRQSTMEINRHLKSPITRTEKSIRQSHSQQHKHATRITINKKLYLISIVFWSSALSVFCSVVFTFWIFARPRFPPTPC